MAARDEQSWTTWVAAVAGLLLLSWGLSRLLTRLLALATREVQARGGDTAFVLGLAERLKIVR